jgi:Gpi18-like mannosyltransferase
VTGRIGPPLLALLAARATSAAVALGMGLDPLRAATWVRWDSNHYLGIAQQGYFIEPCGPGSGLPSTAWCGHTAWFPAYSWLIRAAWKAGADPAAAGAVISLACHAGLLLALWNLFLREAPEARRAAGLALAAWFPGSIYYQAVFPVSLFLSAALIFLWALANEKRLLAALAGMTASASYSTGFLLAPIAVVWGWAQRRRPSLAFLLPAAGVAAGFSIAIAAIWLQTGRWNAFALAQTPYAYSFNPIDALFARLKPLVNARYRTPARFATASQTVLVVVLLTSSLAAAWRARPLTPLQSLCAVYCAAYFLLPLTLGGPIALHRAESLLLPLVLLLPVTRRLGAIAVSSSAALFVALCAAFFAGTIT